MNLFHRAIGLLVLCQAAGFAAAADGASSKDAAARFKQERAACLEGETSQDRATCLREAGAALQEARSGSSEANRSYGDNAKRRCDHLPTAQRGDCIARMQGAGSVSGSVGGGGVVRELVTKLPPEGVAPTRPAVPASQP